MSMPDPMQSRTDEGQSGRHTSLGGSGIYLNGKRVSSPKTVPDAFRELSHRPGAMAWLGLVDPDPTELKALAQEFDLPELLLKEGPQAQQRPNLERYADSLVVVLLGARCAVAGEDCQYSELRIYLGSCFIITVHQGDFPVLSEVRQRLERDTTFLSLGPEAVLYAILGGIVNDYGRVVSALEDDIEKSETEVLSGEPTVSRRIYELSRELIEFQRSALPITDVMTALTGGFAKYGIPEGLQQYLLDVADRITKVEERIANLRSRLRDTLIVNAAIVTQHQNEEMRHLAQAGHAQNEEIKKISAWAAILFAPTLVGNVYGMNFDNMPELQWEYGYPLSIALMAAMSISLYTIFRYRKWI